MRYVHITIAMIFFLNPIYGQKNTTPTAHEKKKIHILSITPEVLYARDFTAQITSIEGTKTYVQSFPEATFGVTIRFKTKNNLNFETGYRWKPHWSTFTSQLSFFSYSGVVDESHSIPFRAIWEKRSKNKRWGISASGGVLVSYMAHSYLTLPVSYGITLPDGAYITNVDIKSSDHSTPRLAQFLDGVLRIDCRVFRHLDLSLGYGGTKGFLNLSEGRYSVVTPSSSFSGMLICKGSYQYMVAGIGWNF
jgi:hypothetical protein